MIDKKTFIESIEIQHDMDKMIETLYSNGIDIIDNSELMRLISNHCKLLSLLVGDDIDDISYFMYELNYGKTYKPGMVTDNMGKDIDFSSAEKLYEYFVNKDNTNENNIKNMNTMELAEYIESVFKSGVAFGKGLMDANQFEDYKKWLTQKYEKEN